jgi:uncharacterized protein (DUF1501 family)
MRPTRREFLGSTLLACGPSVPIFLARSAATLAAQPAETANGRVLVVVELTGGNDGLNTVVPYRDDAYRKHRPKLALPASSLHRIDDHVGLHPALEGIAKLQESRQLAVVQSVGYPNPNRSHLESMAIWQSAVLKPADDTAGWMARSVNVRAPAPGSDVAAIHVDDSSLPQALTGGEHHVPSLISLEQFRRRLSVPASAGLAEQRDALDRIAGRRRGAPGSLLEFVERTATLTYASSARLEEMMQGKVATGGYPESYSLARRLKLIAQLIKAGLTTSLYYTQRGGFDTHAGQLPTHNGLLREVGDSLKAFLDDLTQAREIERVAVLVFSEFGRRLGENASGGTDHGTAAPVFVLGGKVKPGLHGPYPDLLHLQDGDPRHAIDFRRVYATLLDRWLSCPSDKVLGARFEHVPLI